MAIDLKKMKAKLNELQNPTKGGGGKWWKPSDGKQDVRIVPTEDGDPFKSFFFHYNIGERGFLCPKRNFGDECPVCEFASKLFKEGDDDSVAMAKDLFVRQRFFSPVLVRGEEDQGVRVWGYSKTVYETLLNLVLNPDYGDITNVAEGLDLTVEYGKSAGARYPTTNIIPKRKSSPLCKDLDEKECKELLDSVPDFDSLNERKSTEDVQAILDAHLSEEPEGSETERGGSAADVDKAFESLA